MDVQTVVGSVLIGVAVVVITWLTVWSRSKINNLAEQNFPSARDAELDAGDE